VNRVSLPGLSLSAAVVVAALIALSVLETSDNSPSGYQPQPDGSAIVRLAPGLGGGVPSEQSSKRRPKAAQRAAFASLEFGRLAATQARASALARARHGGSAPRRSAARRHGARRRGSSRRGASGLGRSRRQGSSGGTTQPVTPTPAGDGTLTALVPTVPPTKRGNLHPGTPRPQPGNPGSGTPQGLKPGKRPKPGNGPKPGKGPKSRAPAPPQSQAAPPGQAPAPRNPKPHKAPKPPKQPAPPVPAGQPSPPGPPPGNPGDDHGHGHGNGNGNGKHD
jgi:hypothetical protein